MWFSPAAYDMSIYIHSSSHYELDLAWYSLTVCFLISLCNRSTLLLFLDDIQIVPVWLLVPKSTCNKPAQTVKMHGSTENCL